MITCNLTGGLGNQFFQIAAAHALALRNGDESGFDLNLCHTPLQGFTANKYSETIFKNINRISGYPFSKLYNEMSFSFNEIPYHQDMILNGYFQSEKYFMDFKKEIVNLFNIPNSEMVDDFMRKIPRPITSIHIRRGDYLKNPNFHPTCGVEYYKSAMSELSESNFIIISDDKNWVNDNFNGENIWKSNFDEINDLKIMTLCDNNIIANSSFSWWGAYLNGNKNKVVISPNKNNWFGPSGPKDVNDIIPKKWIQI